MSEIKTQYAVFEYVEHHDPEYMNMTITLEMIPYPNRFDTSVEAYNRISEYLKTADDDTELTVMTITGKATK